MFGCKHDYELIDKTVLESGYEQMTKNGTEVSRLRGDSAAELFGKKLVLTFKCPHCKKIKIRELSNP